MAAAAVKDGLNEREEHVEDAMNFCFEHAAYAVLGEETAEGVGVVEKREVIGEASGSGMLLNRDEDGLGVREDGGADGKRGALGRKTAGGGEEGH